MGIRPLIQQKVQNQVGWEKKDIRIGLEPLGGICEGGKVDMGRTLPWRGPLPAGMSTGQIEGLEGPALCSQGVHKCWLARLALMVAISLHFAA